MSESESFDNLIARSRNGDEEAMTEIYRRFQGQLAAPARQQLDERVRHLVEPDEVLNSALKSFFGRDAAGQFQIENWNSLWKLIVRITIRKCYRRNEHFLAARRNVGRVERQPKDDQEMPVAWQAIAREPSPEEAAAAVEAVEQLMRRLPNQRSRDIVAFRLQDYTEVETARLAGCSERTVRRTMVQVRRQLTEILADLESND